MVVDPRESARAAALDAGAAVAVEAGTDVIGEIGSEGAACVFDFVGVQETVDLAASLLATAGHASIVGVGGGTFPLAFGKVPLGASASRPTWGSLPELHEVVALARARAITLNVEELALEDAVEGYRRLRDGDIAGRAVVVP